MIQAIGLTSKVSSRRPAAVAGLTFEARPGRVTVLLGEPRAGKSAALRLMLQLEPARGVALFRGRPLSRIAVPARELGVLIGDVPGHPARTLRDHLRMVAAAIGVPGARADDVLERVALDGLAEERLDTLSLSMDRRLGLAAAMLGDPHTYIADDPGRDVSHREAMWFHGMLRELAEGGATVLTTTTEPRTAARFGDQVITLAGGRMVADEDAEVFARTRLRSCVTVQTPQAGRLATYLARKASTPDATIEVVRQDGNRLDVYGASTATVGEIAYRNGILIHQLTDTPGESTTFVPGPAVPSDAAAEAADAALAGATTAKATAGTPATTQAATTSVATTSAATTSAATTSAATTQAATAPAVTPTTTTLTPGAEESRADQATTTAPTKLFIPTDPYTPIDPYTPTAPPSPSAQHPQHPQHHPTPNSTPSAAPSSTPHTAPSATLTDPLPRIEGPLRPRRPSAPIHPLRYEIRRLTSATRALRVTTALTLTASLLGAVLLAHLGHQPPLHLLAGRPAALPLSPAAIGAGFAGAHAFGQEFRHPALAAALGGVPRRIGLLLAKLVASTVIALLLVVGVLLLDATALLVLYGDVVDLPRDWAAQALAWGASTVGCAWTGVLAAGVFRSAALGLAAVLTVPVAVTPVLHGLAGTGAARRVAELPGRLREMLHVPWPFDGAGAGIGFSAQPLGHALAVSLAVLLGAYLFKSAGGRAR